MSGSSHDDILEEPQTSIGRQQFVVLSRGCVYVYGDEYSSSPMKALSLKMFYQIQRWAGPTPVWGFSLLARDIKLTKSMHFGCISDTERKEWMSVLKESMLKAHQVSAHTTRVTSDPDEYVYLEKEVVPPVKYEPKPKPVARRPKSDHPTKATPKLEARPKSDTKSVEEEEEEEEGSEADYTTIDDLDVTEPPHAGQHRPRPPTIKPPPPTAAYTPVKISKKAKAKVKTPPESPVAVKKTPENPKSAPTKSGAQKLVRKPSEYEYEGSDRAEVDKILTSRPEGTFLVRKSRNDNKQVLSVNVEGSLKEFKIYDLNGKVTLNNQEYFRDLDELLSKYSVQDLPNKTTRLYRAYSVTDPKYVN